MVQMISVYSLKPRIVHLFTFHAGGGGRKLQEVTMTNKKWWKLKHKQQWMW